MKKYITEFVGISERVAYVTFKIDNSTISLIQLYAPTEFSTELELENFYRDVGMALKSSSGTQILLGDLNAKIGQPDPNEHAVLGSYGYGTRNDRGETLIQFCFENQLKIINTYFKKKAKRKWTWLAPNENIKNEIDFIMCKNINIFNNFEVLNLQFPSDHRLLRTTVSLKYKKLTRKFFKASPKIFTEETTDKIDSFLKERIQLYTQYNNVQQLYEYIETALKDCCENLRVSSTARAPPCPKLQLETRNLIAQRQLLKNKENKTKLEKTHLCQLYKKCREKIKDDLNTYSMKIVEKSIGETGAVKRAYKQLKEHKTWIPKLCVVNINLSNRSKIIHAATSFLKNLYSHEHTTRGPSDSQRDTLKKDTLDFLPEEVNLSIKSLKTNKAPGDDNISNEIIIYSKKHLILPLVKLFNLILEHEQLPEQWLSSTIILLYKKGDPAEVSNYRPISLMAALY